MKEENAEVGGLAAGENGCWLHARDKILKVEMELE